MAVRLGESRRLSEEEVETLIDLLQERPCMGLNAVGKKSLDLCSPQEWNRKKNTYIYLFIYLFLN